MNTPNPCAAAVPEVGEVRSRMPPAQPAPQEAPAALQPAVQTAAPVAVAPQAAVPLQPFNPSITQQPPAAPQGVLAAPVATPAPAPVTAAPVQPMQPMQAVPAPAPTSAPQMATQAIPVAAPPAQMPPPAAPTQGAPALTPATQAPAALPSRIPPTVQTHQPQPSVPIEQAHWLNMGQSGQEMAEREQAVRVQRQIEYENSPVKPWRFSLKWKTLEQAEYIILDQVLGPRIYEHEVPDERTGWYTEAEMCVKETETCPLCQRFTDKPSYFCMFLTVIDLRPYTNKKGQFSPAQRVLLPVKTNEQGTYQRLLDQHGSLRGVHMFAQRNGGQTSPRIGNVQEFKGIHSEQQLIDFAQGAGLWEARQTEKGKEIWPVGGFIQPFDYPAVFPRQDIDRLRTLYGVAAPVGSAAEQSNMWGSHAPPPITPVGAPQPQPQPQQPATAPAGTIAQAIGDGVPF